MQQLLTVQRMSQDARRRESINRHQQVEVIRHQDMGVERERVALARSEALDMAVEKCPNFRGAA
jgi:hypothetical protein